MIKAQDLIAKFRYAIADHWGYIWGTAGVKWTLAKQNAATRQSTIDYGRQWIGHTVADCSGLFSWAFKQLGGYMYHGSNTMYKSYCTKKGTMSNGRRTDGEDLKPGTAVFTGTEDNHGHVGLYVGGGTVIEASGTKVGVIESKVTLKKWTYWGELKGVEYDENPEPQPEEKPTLRKGSKGQYVQLVQTILINQGYDLGKWGADGDYGSQTEKAVKEFQKDHGLTADGVTGPKTWAKLLDSPEPKQEYKVIIHHLDLATAKALTSEYKDSEMEKE